MIHARDVSDSALTGARYLQGFAHGLENCFQGLVILFGFAELSFVCQLDGLFEHSRFDFQFFGHGLDGIVESALQGINLVHDLHALVDDLSQFDFLVAVESFGGDKVLLYKPRVYVNASVQVNTPEQVEEII